MKSSNDINQLMEGIHKCFKQILYKKASNANTHLRNNYQKDFEILFEYYSGYRK